MNEQKYSKARALGLMAKRGVTGALKLIVEPYYSLKKQNKEYVMQLDVNPIAVVGPMIRNVTIFTGAEIAKYLLTGSSMSVPEGCALMGLAIEGCMESHDSDFLYNAIKNSWNKAKNEAINARMKKI
jgi:hypothetical protein